MPVSNKALCDKALCDKALYDKALYDKALELSADVEDNFLELGRSLRQLLERAPKLFRQVVNKGNLGGRKAYYLIKVSRVFDPLPIPRQRLRKVGWTKLQVIAKHVTPDNVDVLLELADATTSKDLERQMRGDKPLGNAHYVLMYFSPKDYAELEDALLKHGGVRSGRGIQNKEEAVLAALREEAPGLAKAQPDKKASSGNEESENG